MPAYHPRLFKYNFPIRASVMLVTALFVTFTYATFATTAASAFTGVDPNASFEWNTHDTDAETGMNVHVTDLSDWFANEIDTINIQFPKGFKVNSDLGFFDKDTDGKWVPSKQKKIYVGRAKPLIIGAWDWCTKNPWGPVYLESSSEDYLDKDGVIWLSGKKMRLVAYVKATSYCVLGIPIENAVKVNMSVRLDQSQRIKVRASLPTGLDDLALFDGFNLQIQFPMFKTPPACGNYTVATNFKGMDVFTIWDEWDDSSWNFDTGCDKFQQAPVSTLKTEVKPTEAGSSGTSNSATTVPTSVEMNVEKVWGSSVPYTSLKTVFPKGLLGNLYANPASCTFELAGKDECPMGSKIGNVEMDVQVFQNRMLKLAGGIYIASEESPTGVGRAYVVVKLPEIGSEHILRLISDIDLDTSPEAAPGLSSFRVITKTNGIPSEVDIRKMQLKLTNNVENKKPFLSTPPHCNKGVFEAAQIAPLFPTQESLLDPQPGPSGQSQSSFTATGCDKDTPKFDPEIEFKVKSKKPGNTLGALLYVKQSENEAPMKRATLKFPKRFAINSVKDISKDGKLGKVYAWSPLAQLPFKGELKITDSWLKEEAAKAIAANKPIKGQIELAGKLRGKKEVKVYLDVEMKLDQDMRITTTVDQIPQLPISKLLVNIDEGVIRAPFKCGYGYSATGIFEPHSGQTPKFEASASATTEAGNMPAISGSNSECSANGPAQQVPELDVSSSNLDAGGAPEEFSIKLSRKAGDHAPLKKLRYLMPAGFVGNPFSRPYCAEAAAVNDWCSNTARIGEITAKVHIFDGLDDMTVKGNVYNAKPYSGPGLFYAVINPGGVMSYSVIKLDTKIDLGKDTGYRVLATVDQMPHEVDIREIKLKLFGGKGFGSAADNGMNLLRNQTNCKPDHFVAVTTGIKSSSGAWYEDGLSAAAANQYQVKNCQGLAFNPTLKWSVDPAEPQAVADSSVTLAHENGSADIESTEITLAKGFKLNSLNTISKCPLSLADQWPTFDEICPSSSKIGEATVSSPLLDGADQLKPGATKLKGPVYMIYTKTGEPMKARMFLKGIVDLNVDMKLQVTSDFKLNAKVESLPQLPLSKFDLSLKKGLLNNPAYCDSFVGNAAYLAHSEKKSSSLFNIEIDSDCDSAPQADAPKPKLHVDVLKMTKGVKGVEFDSDGTLVLDGATETVDLFKPFTLAGGHPDAMRFTVTRCLPGELAKQSGEKPCSSEDEKKTDETPFDKMRLKMPPGFVGTPLATKMGCTAENAKNGQCPPESQIGTTKLWVRVGQSTNFEQVEGKIFMADSTDVPADMQLRFWIVLEMKEIAGGKPLALATDIELGKKTGYSAYATTNDIPPDFDVRMMQITIFGNLEQFDRPLFTAPTQCTQGDFEATLFGENGLSDSAPYPYSVIGCSFQPFKPESEVKLDPPSAFKNVTPSMKLAQSTELAKSAGYSQQAHMKSAKLLFPAGLTINDAVIVNYCKSADADAWSCPDSYAVADAVAKSPLLDDTAAPGTKYGPLMGKAFFIEQPGANDAKMLSIFLDGLTKVRIDGTLKMVKVGDKFSIKAAFSDIPQLPVSEFKLDFTKKLVQTPYLPNCPYNSTLNATYSPHAAELTSPKALLQPYVALTQPITISITEGCGPPG